MFGKYFGFRGRALNLAISSLGSLDFLYVSYAMLLRLPVADTVRANRC